MAKWLVLSLSARFYQNFYQENIKGSEVNCEIAELASQRLGIEVITDNRALVMESDMIFHSTKPNYAASVLEEIKDELTPDKLLVSICAGVSTSKIEKIIGMQRVVRTMRHGILFWKG